MCDFSGQTAEQHKLKLKVKEMTMNMMMLSVVNKLKVEV